MNPQANTPQPSPESGPTPELGSLPQAGELTPAPSADAAPANLPPTLDAAAAAAAVSAVPDGPAAPPAPGSAPLPAIANDQDLIEPEWVDKTEEVLRETAGNPYAEEEAIENLQIDYLQKRYGHSVKKPGESD